MRAFGLLALLIVLSSCNEVPVESGHDRLFRVIREHDTAEFVRLQTRYPESELQKEGYENLLVYATRARSREIAMFLLARYEDSTDPSYLNQALIESARNNDVTLVQAILEALKQKGTAPNVGFALYGAIEGANQEVFEYLLPRVDPAFRTSTGENLLFAAAAGGSVLMAKQLLFSGVEALDRNSQGLTPAMLAERRWGKASEIAVLLRDAQPR